MIYVTALTSRVVMTRRCYDTSTDLAPERHVYRSRLTSSIDLYTTSFVTSYSLKALHRAPLKLCTELHQSSARSSLKALHGALHVPLPSIPPIYT